MEEAHEKLHFTRGGELWHCWYRVKQGKFGQHWQKVHGSEEVCTCPEREGDRQALLGISREEART